MGQEPAAPSVFRGSPTDCSAGSNLPLQPAVTVPPMAFHDDRTVLAPHGMVCTVDHLASSAGVAVLRAGGCAADAAVAASAVLAVTTQHMCGMGGDLFVLVHSGGPSPAALASVGRAGSGASAAGLRADGFNEMPMHGDVRSATVPGCIDGWLALHGRFGRLPLAEVLTPAREYAVSGFPVSPLLARAAGDGPPECTSAKRSPPMPHMCWVVTASTALAATAASAALPPARSTATPADEARWSTEHTIPRDARTVRSSS